MTRQFAGLPLHRAYAWAERYVGNFGGRILVGPSALDPIRWTNNGSGLAVGAADIATLDEDCHAEWRKWRKWRTK